MSENLKSYSATFADVNPGNGREDFNFDVSCTAKYSVPSLDYETSDRRCAATFPPYNSNPMRP